MGVLKIASDKARKNFKPQHPFVCEDFKCLQQLRQYNNKITKTHDFNDDIGH